jgi:hypothetical protein
MLNQKKEIGMKKGGIIFFLIVFAIGPTAINAKTLYDNFSGTALDPNKWQHTEFVRQVSGGKLISKIQSSTENTIWRNTTHFLNMPSINVIQCEIIVNEATLDTGTDTESFARIDGFFYNSQGLGGASGDVFAAIHIGDRGNGLEAYWEVSEALDDDLTNFNVVNGEIPVQGIDFGNAYTAKLEYDGANTFTFTVAGVSATFDTGPARKGAAVTQYKGLSVGAYSNGGSGTGFASASFDNVYINNQGTLYDDFSTAPLDETKWQNREALREIDDGMVWLVSHSTGGRWDTGLSFSEIHPYIEATVRVDSSSKIEPGDRGIARLDGYFYNDTYGPGNYNKYQGNVWSGIWINYFGDGTLRAACSADKTLDADDTQWKNLFYRDFNLPIVLDRDYRLSVQFTGSHLRYIIKDTVTGRMDVFGYEIKSSVYEPYDEYRTLLSRVFGNSTGGYMAVKFDDINVDVAEPAATFDATGDWEISGSHPWSFSGCDLPDVNDTSPISITQTGNEFTMVVHEDEGDMTIEGKVYGNSYTFLRRDEENGETEIVYGVFNLSQDTSGGGNVTFVWTDGIDYCETGFDIALAKTTTDGSDGDGGGGGGGCFVSGLNK